MADPGCSLSTALLHAGALSVEGAVVTPIFQSANFEQGDVAEYGAVRYLRLSNSPQQEALAARLAAIEGAEAALALSSGMAAVATTLLSLLSAGDHVLVQRNTYGATATLLHRELARFGVTATDIDPAAPDTWAAAATPRTRVLYVESVSNPCLQVPDLEAVVETARRRGWISIVDNTFLSPTGFRPIPFGFDLVLHSATKYLNGHSDLVAGVVAGGQRLVERVRSTANHLGGSLDPHAAFLLERGLKTLTVRMAAQVRAAAVVAAFLADHPSVVGVHWPGLPTDPHHERSRRFFDHPTPMLSFRTRDAETAERFVQGVTLARHAASLGGVESLVVRPSRSSHLGLSEGERQALGITDALVRVSVGLEDPAELVADFARALG